MASVSGQKIVTTCGTAEALGSQIINGPLMVKALLANTNNAYFGNDGAGDVTSGNGIELDAGDVDDFASLRIQADGTATWADYFNSACDFASTPAEGRTVRVLCGIVKAA